MLDELMLLNCGVGGTLGSPLDCKTQPVHSRDQPWVFFGRNDAEAETPVLWTPHVKSWLIGKDWCWVGLGAGDGDDRQWDGWMASPTRWTWVWANSGSWWWTGRPGVLQFMGSQRIGHDWVTELNWMHVQSIGGYIFHAQYCNFSQAWQVSRVLSSSTEVMGGSEKSLCS